MWRLVVIALVLVVPLIVAVGAFVDWGGLTVLILRNASGETISDVRLVISDTDRTFLDRRWSQLKDGEMVRLRFLPTDFRYQLHFHSKGRTLSHENGAALGMMETWYVTIGPDGGATDGYVDP